MRTKTLEREGYAHKCVDVAALVTRLVATIAERGHVRVHVVDTVRTVVIYTATSLCRRDDEVGSVDMLYEFHTLGSHGRGAVAKIQTGLEACDGADLAPGMESQRPLFYLATFWIGEDDSVRN